MMPGMDGREVCRRMAADPALAHVPVILHSSAAERDVDWRACGADAFLAKPFSTRTLPDLVRQYLSARDGADRRPARLTDDEVRELARQIWQAVRRRPDPNPRDGVLSTFRELSPEDEARVEAALVLLLGGVPAGDEPSNEPSDEPSDEPPDNGRSRRHEQGDDDDEA
jgi:CheY-like chemotaxis protein